jgi:hypothetical protein
MPTFLTNPSNVSNGTTLTSSLYNTYLGTNGTLQYLYESLNQYVGICGYDTGQFLPGAIVYGKATQSIPNNVNTTIIFDQLARGGEYWDGVFANTQTGGCYITNSAPVLLLCSAYTVFASNATGTRGLRINVTATDATVNRDTVSVRTVNRANSAGFLSMSIVAPVIITPNIGSGPTYNTPYFKIEVQVYQNSGGALNTTYTALNVNKLPSC